MKHEKHHVGSRILSILLAMVLMVSGMAMPVQASALPSDGENFVYEQQDSEPEESLTEPGEHAFQNTESAITEEQTQGALPDNQEEASEAAEETPYVYFQYDDGRKQQMDESNTFTLSVLDSGRFVLAGTDKIPDWNVSGRLEESDGSYGTHYWIANDGKYCPADLRQVEGYVCNKDNPGEVFQEFKINNVSGNIEELKAFVGNQEVSLDKPFVMQGSSSGEVYLKAKAKGSEEFKTIPAGAWSHECTSGRGSIENGTQGSIFMLTEDGEATFKLSMYEDPDNLSVDFKAISNKVPDETEGCKPIQFTVRVSKNGVVPGEGDYLKMAKEDIQHGIAYLQNQPMNKYGNEWNIFSTLRAGGAVSQENLDAYYASVSEKLKKGTKTLKATDVARVSITLAAMGKDLTDIEGVDLMKSLYNDELMTRLGKDTSNGPIWALIALDCQKAEIPDGAVWTRDKLIQQILSFQTADGGFGLTDNKRSSIDMTSMALQALAPHRDNQQVSAAFDKAVSHLQSQMTENAGFLDAGKENSNSTAQVLTALTAAGIDPLAKENGFTNGEKNIVANLDSYKADSGFMWQQGQGANGMATQQVVYALEAYRRFAKNENRLYDLTDVEIKADESDRQAANAVIEKIHAIGDTITLESKDEIQEARKAYNALTDKQKKLVGEDALAKLEAAEEELKNLENTTVVGHVVVSVERFTIGQGYIHEPVVVPFVTNDNAVSILKKVIGEENWVGNDGDSAYLEAIVGGDLGSDKVKVPDYIAQIGGPTTEQAKEYGHSGAWDTPNTLGQFDYNNMSGWMYHVNGEEVGYGMASYKPKDGDVLRYQFTLWGYGTDLTGKEWGNPDPVIQICTKDEITRVMAQINEKQDTLKQMPAVKAAYDKAVDLVSAVITPKEEIDAATADLKELLDNNGVYTDVANVQTLINVIGEVTLDSLGKIEAAEVAYKNLSEEKKSYVTNHQTLIDARAAYDRLKEETDKEQADQAAAAGVTKMIEEIGEVTLESLPKIEAAENAYAALTPDQKKYVTEETVAKLTAARAKYDQLKKEADDKAKADEVTKLIDAIGEVTLESLSKIEAAENAYAALTPDQKKYISEETVTKLADARAAYDRLKEETDRAEADKVTKLIDAIGEVTLESLGKIEAAEKAYADLSEEQKNYVTEETVAKMTAARKAYDKLKQEADQEAADKAAADGVIKMIEEIGEVTLEKGPAIKAARAAYEALSKERKELVGDEVLGKLEKAEEELKRLEAENQKPGEDPNKPQSVKMLVNEKYGVKLEGEGLTSDMELKVTPIGKDHADVEQMRKEIPSAKSVFRLYNIQLLKNGKEAELPSESILSIPVGTDYNGKELTVLHCINSKVEKLNGKVTDGVVQVKVSSLESFGVVIDTPASNGNNGSGNNGNGGSNGNGGNNSGNGNRGNGTLQGTGVKTGDETPITALLLMLAASAAVLGATVYKKQKRQAR